MTKHVKTSVGAMTENGWLDPSDVQIWSSGPPGKQVQIKIGETTRGVNAADLIDAVKRCSNIE